MRFETLSRIVSRSPGWVVAAWLAAMAAVLVTAPDLTGLVAGKTTRLLTADAESRQAADRMQAAWPDQAAESTIVVGFHRPGGLVDADREYVRRIGAEFARAGGPRALLRVEGPDSRPEVAERLVSRDGTLALVLVQLSAPFIGPAATEAVNRLKAQVAVTPPPTGVEVLWSGDAVIGSAFLRGIRVTLDRAAVATVVLLLLVLLVVYRSLWLALVPLVTIGISLMITRGVLAWLIQAGWDSSFLVELFLVVILFGCGTDFGLCLTWRFAESWAGEDPARAMPVTLRLVREAIMTSAGTVIVGLSLMGTTRFPLFKSTGPSIALGLALTLAATFTLTPALLILLARYHPRSFAGLAAPTSGAWDRVGAAILARPVAIGAAILAAMAIPAAFGLRTTIVYNMIAELPESSGAIAHFRRLSEKLGVGALGPLSVVIESDSDLRQARGLALIDDLSRPLARQRRWTEVRSATQPKGDPAPLEPARLERRIAAVRQGLGRVAEGARELRRKLDEGAVKLRLAKGLERVFRLANPADRVGAPPEPHDAMIEALGVAAEHTGKIADGTQQTEEALATILDDPFGRDVLGRLLVTERDVATHPDLRASLAHYLSADGRMARIDLSPADPLCSAEAIDGVEALRLRLDHDLADAEGIRARASVGGINAEWADIRAQNQADQRRIWWIVPLGVSIILLACLRDPGTCVNLIATMLLTYLAALGITHLVFVDVLGAAGVDWKVPYFLFILLVALGVDYNVFLMSRIREESRAHGLRTGMIRAIGRTGGLITSAAAITACSFAAFLFSPLGSLRQLGFALVVGIIIDAVLVRPVLVPCGHWLLNRRRPVESWLGLGPTLPIVHRAEATHSVVD